MCWKADNNVNHTHSALTTWSYHTSLAVLHTSGSRWVKDDLLSCLSDEALGVPSKQLWCCTTDACFEFLVESTVWEISALSLKFLLAELSPLPSSGLSWTFFGILKLRGWAGKREVFCCWEDDDQAVLCDNDVVLLGVEMGLFKLLFEVVCLVVLEDWYVVEAVEVLPWVDWLLCLLPIFSCRCLISLTSSLLLCLEDSSVALLFFSVLDDSSDLCLFRAWCLSNFCSSDAKLASFTFVNFDVLLGKYFSSNLPSKILSVFWGSLAGLSVPRGFEVPFSEVSLPRTELSLSEMWCFALLK